MSRSEPVPNKDEIVPSSEKVKYNQEQHRQKEALSIVVTSLDKAVKLQVKDWFLDTLKPLLVIVRVTIIFIFALLADTLIIMIIAWSFSDIIHHNPFAIKLLEGIQLLSALGTAIAYIFYLINSLFKDAKHVLEEIRAEGNGGKVST
jgi:hypothetical protein